MKATDLWKEIPHSTNRVMSRMLSGQEAQNRIKHTYADWYDDFNEDDDNKDCIVIAQILSTLGHVNYGLLALILYRPNQFILFEFRHNKTRAGHLEAINAVKELANTLKIMEGAAR